MDNDDTNDDEGEGKMPTKFEGTWINDDQAEYVFSSNTWQLRRPNKTVVPSGTFTFTDEPTSIRFTATGSGGSGIWTYSYEFKDNDTILNFSRSGGPVGSTGDFTKQL